MRTWTTPGTRLASRRATVRSAESGPGEPDHAIGGLDQPVGEPGRRQFRVDGGLERAVGLGQQPDDDRHSFMPGVLLAVRRVGELPDPLTVGLENLL